MRNLRFLPVLVLMFLTAAATLAQNVSINVSPESGEVGTTFNVTVQGLTPNTEYTLAFIYEDDNSTVFSTTRTSNASGQIALNISSEDSDKPGSYRVEVRLDDAALGAAVFTLTGEAAPSQPAFGGSGDVQLRVTPHSGDIGATYDIAATGLDAGQQVTVSILYAGDEVYRRRLSADENGAVNVEIFTQDGDGAGEYTVQLLDSSGTVLAGDTFVVLEPTGRNGVVDVSQDGDSYQIAISDVKPFADLTVQVISNQSRQPVFTGRVRASVDGAAMVEYTPEAGTPSGEYTISVKEGADVTVASGSLTIGQSLVLNANAQAASLRVTPVSAAPGTLRIITGSGLLAGETVTIEIRSGSDVIYSEEKTADVNGTVALSVKTLGSDAPGDYSVNLIRGGDLLAETSLTIEGGIILQPETPPQQATGVQVEIEPQGGPLGTVYDIRVSGLQPNETVTIAIMFNGRTVFAAERTSSNTGVATLNINSEEGDTPGTYTVSVMRGSENIASADFQVGGDAVEPPPETAGAAEMTVSPAAGERGTTHIITVSNLTAGETVTVEVVFGGASVYSTERTADSSGTISLSLSASETDEAGDYTVTARRGSAIIAQGTMTVLEGGLVQPPETADEVVISIDPPEGVRGDDHTVTVTGLNPDEVVTIEVVYNGSVVYSTERTADRSGLAAVVLSTEDGDPAGDYTIRVQRNNAVAAEATLTVNESSTTLSPSTDETTVSISPESGPVGTSHAVTIRNLTAGEIVTINVLFNGSVQYSTEKTADRAGTVMMRLVADAGDPSGVYTVQVVRDNDVIAQAEMTVEGGTAENTTPPSGIQTTTGEGLLNATEEFTGAERTYTFEGRAGQAVVVQLVSDEFDTFLILRDDSGTELVSNDDFGGGLNSMIGPYILPYTGEYTVVVSSYDSISGSGAVSGMFTVNASTATFSTLEYGQAVTADFSPDASVQYFSFEANEGDIIQIGVDSSGGIDTTLTLNDPTGVQVMFDDDSGGGYDPEITRYIATTSGEYIVVLSGFTLGDSGSARLVVNRETARSLDSGAQQVRLNAKQTADVVTYQGAAGEPVLLAVDVVSGSPEGATIMVIQNGITLMTYAAQDIPAGTVLGFSIPDSGVVSITVQSDGTTVATLEFLLRPEQQ